MGMKKETKVELAPTSKAVLDEARTEARAEHTPGDGCPLCSAVPEAKGDPKKAAAVICSTAKDKSACVEALAELLEAERPSKTHDAWKKVDGLVADADLKRRLFIEKHGGDSAYEPPQSESSRTSEP